MVQPLQIGLIGFGVIGKAHLKAVRGEPQTARVVAVADLLEPRRAEAAAAGAAKVYRDDDELMADSDVQAVIVAVPTGLRDAIVIKALRRGKHVLFEKPPALNAATIERFIALRGALTVACGSARIALGESVAAVSKFIATGALGPLRVVRIHATKSAGKPPQNAPPPWRQSFALNGGGILVNWGVYDLHYMLELTNWQLRPVSVMAQWWPVGRMFADRVADCSDADSHFAAMVRCAGGEIILFERGEFMPARPHEIWQIVGAEGAITMSAMGGKGKVVHLDRADRAGGVASEVLWQGDETADMPEQLRDFAAAVATGRPPRGSLEQCLVIQKVFDGIYASARSGRSVDIA